MSESTVLVLLVTISMILQSYTTLAYYQYDQLEVEQLLNRTAPDFMGLSIEYEYPADQYDVITEDGYILKMFHIPGRSRFPVFLLHGILDSSDTWIIRGKDSLAIALASRGYDVWFGNSRGNKYSRRNVRLNPDEDPAFWNFSFNEIGRYDIPAFIDKILNETGAQTVTAIGHSQGTTSFYVLGATRPEYNAKVNVMISLAPVCYFKHSVPPLLTFFQNALLIFKLVSKLNLHEILGERSILARLYRLICPLPVLGYVNCLNGLIFPFIGYDPAEIEPSFYSKTTKYYPTGTSAKSLLHYLQIGYRNVFAPFDDDFEGNSTAQAPYDLSKITMPMALIAGRNDRLSEIPDVITLRNQLPNVVYYVVSPHLLFNHLDDIWGRQMYIYLFPYIFEVIERYNGVD